MQVFRSSLVIFLISSVSLSRQVSGLHNFLDPRNMEPVVQKILKFNPMYYITQGYRDSFVFGVGVWERPKITLYFWIVTIVIFVAGTYMYKKLRPQFDDVL